jgi:hypothetical protein
MLPCRQLIGIDRRKRMQLGSIAFSFLVVDSTVVSLRRTTVETDPAWAVFAAAGIHQLPHMPALAFQVD